MKPFSLRTRLTIWYSVALLIVLCLVGVELLWQQNRIGLGRIDGELDGVQTTLANVLDEELSEDPNLATVASEVREIVAAPRRAVALVDANGVVLAARWNGLRPPGQEALASPRAPAWTMARR